MDVDGGPGPGENVTAVPGHQLLHVSSVLVLIGKYGDFVKTVDTFNEPVVSLVDLISNIDELFEADLSSQPHRKRPQLCCVDISVEVILNILLNIYIE